jgi:hypothetical protein
MNEERKYAILFAATILTGSAFPPPDFCTKLYRDYPFCPFCLFFPFVKSVSYAPSVRLMDSTSTRPANPIWNQSLLGILTHRSRVRLQN